MLERLTFEPREFELAGTITKVQELPSDHSSVFLTTPTKENIVLKTNKPKWFWMKATQMGKQVVIKGRHPIEKNDVEQITIVRNSVEIQYLSFYANGDVQKYEQGKKALDSISDAYREDLARQAAELQKRAFRRDESAEMMALGHHEMIAKYIYLYVLYPPETKSTIENYLRVYDKTSREEKDRIDRRLSMLINYVPGSFTEALTAEVKKVRDKLDELFPGQTGIKNGLLNCLMNFQLDPRHKAPRICIQGPKRSDLHRLIMAFFIAIRMNCTPFACAGMSDNANLIGSSSIYSNCSLGSLAESLRLHGSGAMYFKDVDLATKPETLMPIQSILEGWYANELLESPMDVSGEWIIMTCTNAEKIPFDISAGVIMLEAEDYSEEEMLGQVKCMQREFCRERGLPENRLYLSADVRKALAIKYSGKNDCCELRKNVDDILQNALLQNMGNHGQIKINEDNFVNYFSLMKEADHLKNDHLNGINEVKRKLMLYYEKLPKGIRERILRNLDELEVTKDEDKKKQLTRKTLELGNVKTIEPLEIDFSKVRKAFCSMYALDKVKERILDYLYSVSGKKKFRFQPIILYGPAGVGKTTLAKAIGEALSMACIIIAFNQLSDPKDLTGYPDFMKSCNKGLLGRLLEFHTVCDVCVILDELDKPLAKGMHDVLHNILDKQDVMDQEYDCSYSTDRILFIATANDINAIPYTIRNRCELIKVEPYSIRERMEMTRRFILPKAVRKFGIQRDVLFEDEMLHMLLTKYTMTGGVRETEVAIDRILRRMVRVKKDYVVSRELIEECLGFPLAGEYNDKMDWETCGVAKALAVTDIGGTLFNVRVCHNTYGPEAEITGLAKNSFLESINVAMSLASRLTCKRLDNANLHIHSENAGIEKDGPSAGLCILSAILSLETGIPLGNVAFTGEIENCGKRILAIGGLKDKLTAAERNCVETVYVPKSNYDQLVFENALAKFDLEIVPVASVADLCSKIFPDYAFPGFL